MPHCRRFRACGQGSGPQGSFWVCTWLRRCERGERCGCVSVLLLRCMRVWAVTSMAGPLQDVRGSVHAWSYSYRAVLTSSHASVAAAEFLLRQLSSRDTGTAGTSCTGTSRHRAAAVHKICSSLHYGIHGPGIQGISQACVIWAERGGRLKQQAAAPLHSGRL